MPGHFLVEINTISCLIVLEMSVSIKKGYTLCALKLALKYAAIKLLAGQAKQLPAPVRGIIYCTPYASHPRNLGQENVASVT